jgi:hypothetical protein
MASSILHRTSCASATQIGIGLHIGNMDDFALLRRAPKYRPPARLHRTVVHVLVIFGRVSVARDIRIGIAARAVDGRAIGLAQPRPTVWPRVSRIAATGPRPLPVDGSSER